MKTLLVRSPYTKQKRFQKACPGMLTAAAFVTRGGLEMMRTVSTSRMDKDTPVYSDGNTSEQGLSRLL